MSLLITALVIFLVVVLATYLVNMLPVEARIKRIIQLVVVAIGLVALLRLIV